MMIRPFVFLCFLRNGMKFCCCVLIRVYQIFISPLFPACCRFYPTCSAYALEAFGKHGIRKGFLLSARRILRCNPYCTGGFDPVP